jgi:hypothetical protein
MTKLSRAASATALLTSRSELISRIRSICVNRRFNTAPGLAAHDRGGHILQLACNTAKRQNQRCKKVPCATQFRRCEAERATLRFDPDRISEIGESMHVAARVDVLGADLPAA